MTTGRMNILGSEVKTYKQGELVILVSKDKGLWHLSVSHATRYPTYDEIKEARYKYIPDKAYMAMIFPPKKEFINVHPNCFHLWEIEK